MQGVITVGDALVAWGFYLDEDICPAPMLWRSTDGVAWLEVSDPVGLRSLWRSVSTAATDGLGLTAIGTTGGRASGLTTSDGFAWTAHDMPEDLDYGPIIAVPGGFLAGGAQALWFSPDGAGWTVLARPRMQFELFAAAPGSTIAIGPATNDGSNLFDTGTDVWLGPPVGG